MTVWRWATGAVLVSAVVIWSCSGGGSGEVILPAQPDAGVPPTDAGPVPDAGVTDAGTTDAGTDGGTTDGGTVWVPPPPVPFPSPAAAGWAFYGPQNGGPHDVFGVSADQGGNIWVAGGEDGLFLMRAGTTTFVRFTMNDGLRPYGYMPDGSDPVGPKFLNVLSVAGGPANTVFVGYEGRPGCEGEWDPAKKPGPLFGDPSIYKSGDADRVTVDAAGKLTVVHYDIFSGPGVVGQELQGREKLCSVLRIVWNPATNDVWFGANHGFAWGDGNFAGNPKCNGLNNCAGLVEHTHPYINGRRADGSCCDLLTGDYRGIAVDPSTGDTWFGGINRSTKFHWAAAGRLGITNHVDRFLAAEAWTENNITNTPNPKCTEAPCYRDNRFDVWPDAVPEEGFPSPSQRTDDNIFAIAAEANGTAWFGSGAFGLRHLNGNGTLASDETARIAMHDSKSTWGTHVGGLALDTDGKSLWVGSRDSGGVHRLSLTGVGADQIFSTNTFGDPMGNQNIEDVQIDKSGPTRKVLFGFRQDPKNAGFIAVYSGD